VIRDQNAQITNWSLWQKQETITFANPDIDQSDAFISGGREYARAIHFSRPVCNDSEA